MKINADASLQKIIDGNVAEGIKPPILLHSCCAPCSSASIERLKQGFSVTVYYYNPNIDSEEEYIKRAEEQKRLCREWGLDCVVEEYRSDEFYSAVKGYEDCPEGGERCFICYRLRLAKTARYAEEHGFRYFATTLTLSPLKNADKLNGIGRETATERAEYLPTDFKKRDGYLRSIRLSEELGLYRQNYCGCVFSVRAEK